MDPTSASPTKAGRLTRKPDYVPDDPLLTAAESAAELGIGLSTFWRDVSAGWLPRPFYITPRCPRWRRSELHAVIADCRKPATAR